jgi:hypothetical protein
MRDSLVIPPTLLFNKPAPHLARLTSEFTGLPRGLGFQENPGSAAPVQHLLARRLFSQYFSEISLKIFVFGCFFENSTPIYKT